MPASPAAAAFRHTPRTGSLRSGTSALALACALTCLAAAACSPGAGTPAATTTPTALRQAWFDGSRDVFVAGHVTYVAPEDGIAFIQDATRGIVIDVGPEGLAASPGDYVILAARVRDSYELAHLTRPRVLQAQRSALPEPTFADPEAFSAGALNARRIKLAGRVQAATRQGNGLTLSVTSRGYELAVYIRDAGTLDARDLLGSEIRLRGVVEPGKDGTRDSVPGLRVLSTSAGEIEIVRRVDQRRPSPLAPTTLTSVAQIRRLPYDEAARSLRAYRQKLDLDRPSWSASSSVSRLFTRRLVDIACGRKRCPNCWRKPKLVC